MLDILTNFLGHLTLHELEVLKRTMVEGGEDGLFAAMWRLPAAHEYLSAPLSKAVKSEVEADRLRNEGNANFVKKRLDHTMKLFNDSLRVSPHPPLGPNGEEVPVTFSLNRGGPACTPATEGEEKTPDGKTEAVPSAEGDELGSTEQESLSEDGVTNLNGASQIKDETSSAGGQYLALARGYGNRSAVFFHMGLYHECVRDVDRALKYNQEEAFQKKLLARKGECLEAIEREGLREHSRRSPSPPQLESKNPKHPNLSRAVRIDYSQTTGRRLVADRNISSGELIMTEECRWGVILDDYMTTHCSDCLTLCLTPVPCPTCHLVVFCNEDCRARGWSRFHSRECPVLPTLKALDLEMHIIMAVKNVITASFVTMKEEMPPILRDRAQGRVRVPLGEESFDPAAFRNLILSDNRTANPEKKEFLAYCIAAVLMTKILQESGHFFVDRDGHAFEPSDDDLQMTGMAIYLLLLTSLVRANVFSFDERINGGQKSAIHFSAGIFPTICMTKQSCNPSTVLYRCGPAVVLRAVGPIAAGEPITTMSSHYGHTTLAARQKAFSELGIQCDCVACVEEWPIYENLPEGFSLKCPKCSHPLRRVGGTVRCEHHAVGLPARPGEDSCWGGCLRRLSGGRRKAFVGEDMDEMRSLYSVVERFEARWKFMRKGEETDEDLRLMAEATEVLEKHGVLPSKLYHDAKIRLTTCYATRELDLP